MKIQYLKGDATNPINVIGALPNESKRIMHVCNDVNLFGAGFALALSKKWNNVKTAYHHWWEGNQNRNDYHTSGRFGLGEVQTVNVEDNIAVFNMIAQRRVGALNIGNVWIPPIDYRSMKEGFARIKLQYKNDKFTLHAPRLGCGLAGGKWEVVLNILEVFRDTDIEIYVYDL